MGRQPAAEIKLMRSKMLKVITIVIVVMGVISCALIWKFAPPGSAGWWAYGGSYFLGALIGVLNGVIGFLTIERFIDRSNLAFMKGVFIGMGVRLLLLLGVFIILVKVFEAHIIALVTGLLIFYFGMTIFEVVFLNKRIEMKKTTQESVL